MKKAIILLLFLSGTFTSKSQENILVNTNSTQIILKVDADKNLTFEYYGKKLNRIDDLFNTNTNTGADAYPAFGIRPDKTIAIRAKHANLDLTLVLKYQSHEVYDMDTNVDLTTIHLKDEIYPFYVDIKYKTFKAEDVIEMWTEISHTEKNSVTLFNYASAYLAFKEPTTYISHFHGNWGTEFTMEEFQLKRGKFSIESKEGIRSSTKDNASFFLGLGSALSENKGDVIAGALAWTGNFDISFAHDEFSTINITAGINNYASEYTLDKGKKFITPALILTYSNEGKGQASRNLHRYARKYKMVGGGEERKILLNSWEGVYFDFNEDKIIDLIDDTASIGGELFVLDDGWFGNKYSRDKADQGLGDWQVSKKKLPNGIEKLIDESENRGIKFGIWVEPEMANTSSELYENHPDWVLQNAGRELVKGRGKTQVVLDLSNPKVQDFVFNTVNDLLNKNPHIDYIKWDANAAISNYGSTYLSKEKQSHLYIDYHSGLQSVLKRLREKHPNIIMQACASGGGRTNYGFLQYFSEFWPSDNTDALQRIYIQWGMSHVFPAITMASHVSASPNHQTKREIPIKFRFDVAMTGRLGLELQPKNMTDEEKAFSKAAISVYKDIRPIIQFGDLYRIVSPYQNKRLASLIYVDEQKKNAVFFAYYLEKQVKETLPYFKFQGLDPTTNYTINEINKYAERKVFGADDKTFSGSFLMNTGVKLNLSNEYDSVILHLTAK
ncbi:alpha-galactosidase [Mariniflexile sp.]|uniref:alpha-galactosidase n=1 Tax=Mariniflexile sp. TaxID=1979402 RepID=UPI0040482792